MFFGVFNNPFFTLVSYPNTIATKTAVSSPVCRFSCELFISYIVTLNSTKFMDSFGTTTNAEPESACS